MTVFNGITKTSDMNTAVISVCIFKFRLKPIIVDAMASLLSSTRSKRLQAATCI